jgi:hypothetical protein
VSAALQGGRQRIGIERFQDRPFGKGGARFRAPRACSKWEPVLRLGGR